MAVFTPVSREQLDRWMSRFELGRVIAFAGVASGIENSNFFVDTERGRFVLTLFERLTTDEVPFYLGLMRHLAARGIPCPDPVADRGGALVGELQGRPAALVTRLAGAPDVRPGPGRCAEVGALLARMHRAAADYPGTLPNPRGIAWWAACAPRVAPFLSTEQAALLADELAVQQAFAAGASGRGLPSGAVHADLFRDNVFFDDAGLSGVIDFYFAGCDTWLFDLAVTCNDWCIVDATGELDPPRLDALLRAYTALRAPVPAERDAWPTALRAAALRFWLSRLFDLHLPRPAQIVRPKDPAHFERILRERRRGAPVLA